MGELPVTAIQSAARPVVEAASAVYLRHLRPWLIGMVLHGSALKGGFIQGCSDVDLQLYLQEEAFTSQGHLPLEVCMQT